MRGGEAGKRGEKRLVIPVADILHVKGNELTKRRSKYHCAFMVLANLINTRSVGRGGSLELVGAPP